jgi:Ca-activated chloride channel family protein
MRKKSSALMPLIAIIAISSVAWLDPYRDAVSSGNEEFGKQKYNNAKRYYEKAERYVPTENDKKKLSFNNGDADYMLENFDSALSGFQQAIQSDDRDVQKKAFFNIGNAYLKQKNYREAINAYMNALKIDPDYAKAKKNIEYVLKQMDNKNKQNNKDKKDNKDKNDDNQKNKDKSSKGDKNQDKKQNSRQGGSQMNREQVQNILRSLQQSPVRRQKGGGDERRKLEKFW